MRIFIAIPLPEYIKTTLFNIQKELSGFAKINWVPKKNLHLTIKFLGNTPDQQIQEIISLLTDTKFKKIKATLDKLGAFPSLSHINTIWVSATPAEPIINLQQQIDQLLLPKFPQDQRFSVHITIGRVKFVKQKEELIRKIKELQIPKKEFEIDKFELIKSTLTDKSPIYEVIKSFQAS